MLRSHWYGAVFLVLGLIGLAWGQASNTGSTSTSEKPKDRFITVKELEKPSLRCKVLKTWTEPDGSKAYLVQSITTLEKITIIEAGPLTTTQQGGAAVKAVSTRIFHWGKEGTPPEGTPTPPSNALVLGQPLTEPMTTPPSAGTSKPATPTTTATKTTTPPASTISKSGTMPTPPAPVVSKPTLPTPPAPLKSASPAPTSQVAAKPPTPPTPESMWPPAFATGSKTNTEDKDSAKSLAGKPLPPIPVVKKPEATPARPVETKVAIKPLPPSADVVPEVKMPASGTATSKMPPAKSAASMPSTTVATNPSSYENSPSPRPTIINQRTKDKPEIKAGPVVMSPLSEAKDSSRAVARMPADVPPSSKDIADSKPVASSETVKSSEWRQSWGKTETAKPTTVAKTDKPATSTPLPSPWPTTNVKQPDPLQAPDSYRKVGLEEKETKKTVAKPKEESSKPTPPAVTDLSWENNSSKPVPGVVSPLTQGSMGIKEEKIMPRPVASTVEKTEEKKSVVAKVIEAPKKDTPPAPLPPIQSSVPLGMGSVAAAMSPELEETPSAAMPGKGTPVAVADPRGNAFMATQPGISPPTMMSDRGAPPGMANAFTPSGSARPIPADFGSPGPVANAFTPGSINDRRQPNYPQGQVVAVNPTMAVPPRLPVASSASLGNEHASLPQLLSTLKDSLYPYQREWAAEKLATLDWHKESRIVDSLTWAAHEDPAPTVRAACVHCLAQMRLNTMPVVSVLQSLQRDNDPRVRHEVEQALAALGVPAQPGNLPIQPASMPVPK